MSTRELILLRHAKAESEAASGVDAERKLSARGEVEAAAAGAWLKAHKATFDRVLCSPAERARQTGAHVLSALGVGDCQYEAEIYEATPGQLMALLDRHSDSDRVLLIGHNPGIEALVALLSTGQSGDFRGVPTAGIAWLKMPAGAALEPGVAKVTAYWSP